MKKKEKYRAGENYTAVRDAILELVMRKKLDAIDLLIMAERDCSPMPTMREMAPRIGVDIATISRRMKRIKKLIKDENKNIRLV